MPGRGGSRGGGGRGKAAAPAVEESAARVQIEAADKQVKKLRKHLADIETMQKRKLTGTPLLPPPFPHSIIPLSPP